MKKNRFILPVIIGLLIIYFILIRININELLSNLRKTAPFYFILACLSYFCMNLVLATRLRYLLNKTGYQTKFPPVLLSHMGGMIIGDITPGRGGYFLTPTFLKKRAGTSVTDGMACIFAPQAIEFILKVGGAFAAILYISHFSWISSNILISAEIGSFILLIVGVLMLILSWKSENISSNFLNKIPFFRKFNENLISFKEKSIGVKDSIKAIILLYFIGWIFAALHWYYLGTSLGIDEPFFVFILLHPLLTILMFAPTPAGLGFMELGTFGVFSLLGVSGDKAVAFSFLVRASMVLVDLIGLKTVLTSLKDIEL